MESPRLERGDLSLALLNHRTKLSQLLLQTLQLGVSAVGVSALGWRWQLRGARLGLLLPVESLLLGLL